MASNKAVLVTGAAVATAMAMLLGLASAQSGCTTVIIGLSPCLNYITGNDSVPSTSCCSQLASVVQSQPACLCSLLNGGASSLGITINQTRALALPAACRLQTPPVSRCNAGKSPTPSPPAAPANPATEATPTSPPPRADNAEGGSKATPTTISNGTSHKSIDSLMLSTIFLLACVFFTNL